MTMTPKQERNGVPGPTSTHNTAEPVVPSAESKISSAMGSAESAAASHYSAPGGN